MTFNSSCFVFILALFSAHSAMAMSADKVSKKSASNPVKIATNSVAENGEVVPPTPPAYSGNPYLAYTQGMPQPTTPNPFESLSKTLSDIGAYLPTFSGDESLLPHIKKVYPTGEKPMVVVTFKCPIEMAGVKGGPVKILHQVVASGMDVINSTNLLPFNLQQVCQ